MTLQEELDSCIVALDNVRSPQMCVVICRTIEAREFIESLQMPQKGYSMVPMLWTDYNSRFKEDLRRFVFLYEVDFFIEYMRSA